MLSCASTSARHGLPFLFVDTFFPRQWLLAAAPASPSAFNSKLDCHMHPGTGRAVWTPSLLIKSTGLVVTMVVGLALTSSAQNFCGVVGMVSFVKDVQEAFRTSSFCFSCVGIGYNTECYQSCLWSWNIYQYRTSQWGVTITFSRAGNDDVVQFYADSWREIWKVALTSWINIELGKRKPSLSSWLGDCREGPRFLGLCVLSDKASL